MVMVGAPPSDEPHEDRSAWIPGASFTKGSAMAETRRLDCSRSNRQVAGVCGGLAQYFDLDATLIRILFVVLAVLGGSGLLVYVAMWIIVPTSRQPSGGSRPPRSGDGPCSVDQTPGSRIRRIPVRTSVSNARGTERS